jgi:hypothetical protein
MPLLETLIRMVPSFEEDEILGINFAFIQINNRKISASR